jgi:hypothetical protein
MRRSRCDSPTDSCSRSRRWSARLSRWIWVCECGRAFTENSDGSISGLPLRGDVDPRVTCPDCRAPMVLVCGSRNGNFYSCSRYPACRGTRPVDHANDGGSE